MLTGQNKRTTFVPPSRSAEGTRRGRSQHEAARQPTSTWGHENVDTRPWRAQCVVPLRPEGILAPREETERRARQTERQAGATRSSASVAESAVAVADERRAVAGGSLLPLHLMEGAGEAPAVPLTKAVVMIHAAADSYNQQRCQGTVRPVESRLYLCRAKAERARRARGWTRRAADALLNQKRATDGTRACDDGAVHRCEREMIHAAVRVPLGGAADVWLEVARALGAERQHVCARRAARQRKKKSCSPLRVVPVHVPVCVPTPPSGPGESQLRRRVSVHCGLRAYA